MWTFDFETEIAGNVVGLLGAIGDSGAVNVTEVRAPAWVGNDYGAGRVDAAVPLPPEHRAAYLAAHRPEIDDIVRDHAHAASAAAYEARWSR